MAPSRFRREKREVTPFADDPPLVPEEIPAEWRGVEAPPNFTWVGQDELAGMGWPKSRDQIRFLVEEQGVDHLVTLSADKIPPYYAFPELKWSLIPVEDFHGPSIRDIKRFLNIMDEARKAGEVRKWTPKVANLECVVHAQRRPVLVRNRAFEAVVRSISALPYGCLGQMREPRTPIGGGAKRVTLEMIAITILLLYTWKVHNGCLAKTTGLLQSVQI